MHVTRFIGCCTQKLPHDILRYISKLPRSEPDNILIYWQNKHCENIMTRIIGSLLMYQLANVS